MKTFPCAFLGGEVELTEERERSIRAKHPDLLPAHEDALRITLGDPDSVRRDVRFPSTRVFSRWFDDVKAGKFVVAIVVSEGEPDRHWIVTAYIARRLATGTVEWQRP